MSTYQTKPNTGSLFKNEGDRKRENGPDYSGTALIDGDEYFMDAWLKTSESGRRWMSFSFKPKQRQEARQEPARQAQRPTRHDDPNDPPF